MNINWTNWFHHGLWETGNPDPPQATDNPIPTFEAELTIDDTYCQLPLIDYWSQ